MRKLIAFFLLFTLSRGDAPPADDGSGGAAAAEPTEAPTTTTTTQAPITAPPLGELSKILQNSYTPNSIRAGLSDYSEEASKRRFDLVNLLTSAFGEKNISLSTMQGLAQKVKFEAFKYAKKVDNVTQILMADASAGGLQATSRELMAKTPQAQKMLSKMMKQQLKNLETDGRVLSQLFKTTTEEYAGKMEKYSETLTNVVRNQDAAFARFASGQAGAMKNSANLLRQNAATGLSGSKTDLVAAVQAIANTGATATKSLSALNSGVSNTNNDITNSQRGFKTGLSDAQDELDDELRGSQADAENGLGFAAMKSTDAIEGLAESAGTAASREFSSLDSAGKKLLGEVIGSLSTAANKLAKTVDKATSTALSQVSAVGDSVTRQVSSITGKSSSIAADNRDILADLQKMLGLNQADASAILAAFTTQMNGVQNGVGGSFGEVLNSAKNVASDVNGDASNELARQNKYIQYLMELASSQAGSVAGNAQTQLSQKQIEHAKSLAMGQTQIDQNSNALKQAMEWANRNGLNQAAAASDRINGAAGTMSGSIADLLAMISDSSGGAAAGLSDLQSQFGSRASSTFTDLVESLRGANNDGTNTAEDLIRKIVGPNADAANSQFGSMRDMLSNLLSGTEGQSNSQDDAMDGLKNLQRLFGSKVGNVGQSMNGIFALNSELSNTVGNQGGTMLSDKRAAIIKALQDELAKSQDEANGGVNVIDQLIHGTNGMNKFDNEQQIAQGLGSVGSDMESGNTDLVEVQKAQVKALTGLSSMAVSLLGQSKNQGASDSNSARETLAKNKASIISKFREIAVNTTGTELGDAMSGLLATGNSTKILDYLTGDVQTALKNIEADSKVARDVNNQKRSQFDSYLSSVERDVRAAQAELATELDTTIRSVQGALVNKTTDLNSTKAELETGLAEIKEKVETAQTTLRQNLFLYRDKLRDIIDQIRKYMNMSGDADELAIQNDIARQMAKVNSTEVSIASANAAVEDKLKQQNATRSLSSGSEKDIVNSLIEGSMMAEEGATDGHLASNEKLVGVATGIDDASNALETSLSSSSSEIASGISKTSADSASSMRRSEGEQAKKLEQLSVKSGDVSTQARKAYITNLEKMRGVSDDTLMLSTQLSTLLGSADGTIKDVSGSTMDHMDLSAETMAMLNKQAARKVASISDVMDAFTSVVLAFLNETTASMTSLKGDMGSIQNVSSVKLHQMATRTTDELNWIESNYNKSQDSLAHLGTQNDALHAAFDKGTTEVGKTIKSDQTARDKENRIFVDEIDQIKQKVIKNSNDQLAKVRAWLRSRNPVIAQQILSSSSLIESKSSDTPIRALNGDIED